MLIAAALGVASGCQSMTSPLAATKPPTEPPTKLTAETPVDGAVALATHMSTNSAATAAESDTADLRPAATLAGHQAPEPAGDDKVLRELQQIMAADPAAAGHLVAQLQTVKPSLRPLVAEQFRSSWEYHRELTGQGAPPLATRSADLESSSATPHMPGDSLAPPVPTAPPSHHEPSTHASNNARAYDPAQFDAGPATIPAVTNHDQQHLHLASMTDSAMTPRANPSPPAINPRAQSEISLPGWQELLEQAIDRLAANTPDDPRSTHEAYAHARLRLLQLVAGDEDAAVAPIPGLTPTEQGYWSNQLFALATLLDYQGQANDEERAALASAQLADAAARLGELSALSVRNMAFAKQVFGFGDYEPIDKPVFQPGQQVTLYAEIENYRSESTKKGFHTSLATSYEVLDKNGDRIEGGEFATVDDYCMRRRRDFYIEYTIALPSRIYPSDYQLRLMIRDRLGGKFGKSTVKFAIAE